ncbi:ABC transporter ATP-binding protein [Desulfosporosinus fructosivorans]|uniref:ABC transporter ATP-binding protein n=1 Tax=Desulfosporosinus fructosivorans TaxID=2018669 RepID=A0A4Z0R736_9FIRM|nr:ABC transporter ATP-binding protein [Desulfosporosinus fructosivorans]TGE38620.1 ABC transporter ATP-binding protein [Desulfosporosinus fructosivorans]
MILEIKDASFGYGKKTVLRNISFQVGFGEFLCLLGPNGVGKTTLFKSILGFLAVKSGEIMLNGQGINQWSKPRLAKVVGYVPQAHTPPFPYTVLDVVLMGRIAHLGSFSSPSREDVKIAEESLDKLGAYFLKDMTYTEISGGERQMVLIARALTQRPQILILDEPTSNLDYGNQVRVLLQIKKLSDEGMTVVMTSHYPDHAFLCTSKVALLNKKGFEIGTADEIITEKNMKDTYGINVRITRLADNHGADIKRCVALAN